MAKTITVVKDLKEFIEDLGDNMPVVFEILPDGKPSKESYSVDKMVAENGFLILQSID